MRKSILRRLVDGADLQEECIPGQPVLEALGMERILIENHSGILEYSTERIRVQVRFGNICVCGCSLSLRLMKQHQLVITGEIQNISLNRR